MLEEYSSKRFHQQMFLKSNKHFYLQQPLMLARVIRFFADPKGEDFKMACLNAAGVVGASLFYIICHHPACYMAARVAIKARVGWCTLMFRKVIIHSINSYSVIYKDNSSFTIYRH